MTVTALAPSVDGRWAPEPGPATAGVDVLHVPFTYFPDPVGGTEVYVAGLARAMSAAGLSNAIAAPGASDDAGEHEGIPVYRFAGSPNPGLDAAYGKPDEDAARAFSILVGRLRPRLVHLHSRTAAVSERLVDVAHGHGAKVVFTYHTPTVSCVRGTMMWMGAQPCDGRLDVRRCTRCLLQDHGAPAPLDLAFASLPQAVGELIGTAGVGGGVFTALRASALVGGSHRRFRALMDKADRIVAVSDWVREVLLENGVPPAKILLCRQGVESSPTTEIATPVSRDAAAGGPLRIGYFGRIDPTKGIDLLVEAFSRSPGDAARLDIYGVVQAGSEVYAASLERAAAADRRVSVHSALAPGQVCEAMANCDLVAVPSRLLETGPMVVLEAFAAGAPVLGARLGGIAELVRDGVDGVLVKADDPSAWADAISALAANPAKIAELRGAVRPPRTMADVTRDMIALYETMLGR
jgi:glycosyltransferase involved in cell wall biosynthesis